MLKLADRALSCSDEMVGSVAENPARGLAPMVASKSLLSALMLTAPVFRRVKPWVMESVRLMLTSGASRSV